MVKAKRRQLAAIAAEKVVPSADEDGWVLVKKQKITILIPPLPVQPLPRSSRMKLIQNKSRTTVKSKSHISAKRHYKHALGKQKKSTPFAFRDEIQSIGDGMKAIDANTRAAHPDLASEHLPLSTLKTSEGLDSFVHKSPLQPSLDLVRNAVDVLTNGQHNRSTCNSPVTHAGASQQPSRISETLKTYATLRRKVFSRHLNGRRDVQPLKSFSCLSVGALQNQQIREVNVEKKLRRAGGLNMWLISQGLGQFIQIFKRENIDKIQLLNLTMGELKDMGATAVGPRRKLIHAIDTLCQPYYF